MVSSLSGLIRKATHAGSWYTNNGQQLNTQLQEYLNAAERTIPADKKLRAIIGPHAGFSYSGPT